MSCQFHSAISRVSSWFADEYLVGGIPTPLKNMSSSVGSILLNIWKVIKFHGSKPTTGFWLGYPQLPSVHPPVP